MGGSKKQEAETEDTGSQSGSLTGSWEDRFDKLLEDNAFEDYLDPELNRIDKEFMPKTIKSFIKSLLSEKDSYILHIENVKEKMRVCIEKKDKEISELNAEIEILKSNWQQ